MTPLENLYKDWIQCENYDVLSKLKVCKGIELIHQILDYVGINLFLDQWMAPILVLLFIGTISVMLAASLSDEQIVRIFGINKKYLSIFLVFERGSF